MIYKNEYRKVIKPLNIIPWTLLVFLCSVSYGRGRMVPPEPEAPEEYEAQLQEAETVEDVRQFLVDIGDLQSLDRPSAQLLAFEKLITLPDKNAAIDILSKMFHEGAYVHMRSLSGHVKRKLIRTLGKIGTPKAKAEVNRILEQALQLEKVADSARTSQLGIINAAMETLAEKWYQTPEIREHLRQIAKQFDEHSETVRTNACKYYFMSEMRVQGIIEKKDQVKWLLEILDYETYEKRETEISGDIYVSFEGDKQTWPGLKNEAILETLKDLYPDVTDYLEKEKAEAHKKNRRNVIEYFIKQTSLLRATCATNYLRQLIRGANPNSTKWWASRLNIPEERLLDKKYITRAVDMLHEKALRHVIDEFENIDPGDDERRKLQDFILERSKKRLQKSEKNEETVLKFGTPVNKDEATEVSPEEEKEVEGISPEEKNEVDRGMEFLWPIIIVLILAGGGIFVALAFYFSRIRSSRA